MDLSAYLLQGFNILPKINAIVNGTTVEAVFNQSTHVDNKVAGGYEPDNLAVLAIKTSLLTSPRALKGKIVFIFNVNWRVLNVQYGDIITHLTVVSDDKP